MSFFFAVKYVRNSAGKDIAIYEGFTFFCHIRNKQTDTWDCSQSGPSPTGRCRCKARLIISKDRQLLKDIGEHNHVRPNFVVRNGVIIKL